MARTGKGEFYGLSFNRENRLVATSEDLFLRLYDDQLQLLIKAKPPSDFEPQAVAFSPDGSEIAVVYYNSNRLDIVDGDTLAARFTPDISQINNGTLSTVGWSADGETLYSGGSFDIDGISPLVAWPARGRGSPKMLDGALNAISDISTLPGGGVGMATADPSFGAVDKQNKFLPMVNGEPGIRRPVTADMRGKRTWQFLVRA